MAKGVKSIKGNTQPKVGETNYYEVSSYYPGTDLKKENDIKWKLYVQQQGGSWRELRGPLKTGKRVPYLLPEKWSGKKMMVEAYIYNPEKKPSPGLIVTPIQDKIPKINDVGLLYVDDTKGSVFSFTEKLRARANCTNMFGKELLFTLWEDDAKGTEHSSKNKPIDTKKAKVNEKGIAVTEFLLTKALMKKAMEGEVDPKQLEFYVTVEYYAHKKHPTDNVNINNPFPQAPKPQTTQPKTPPKAKGSPAESKGSSKKEEKGIGETIGGWIGELWDWWEGTGTIKKQQPPTQQKPDGKSPAIVKGEKSIISNCGEKYCIKKGDKSELIREINIRLAGFGGNIPTDEFTDKTEKMIKQFQKDYMKVPETGKVCGNVLLAIDDFCLKWAENITNYLCLCKNEKAIKNKCSGFGKGQYKGQYSNKNQVEKYHKYERPGIHRSLLWGVSALKYYLSIQKIYKYYGTTAGYRCWEHNTLKGRATTNHMGKAVDLQFSKNGHAITGKSQSNISLLEEIRDNFFTKYLNSKYQWVNGTNNFSLEPFGLGSGQTWSWIHMDVREFDNEHLDDKFFTKTQDRITGKNIIQLAVELGFQNTCNCSKGFESPTKPKDEKATPGNCEDKFKKIAPIILRHEGGYVNHPSDKGGATNKGITFATWKKYAKEDLNIEPTLNNLKNITDEQATKIYRKRYWEPKGFCKIEDERVGLMIYDWTITSGGAGKQVQRLLKNEFEQAIDDDGAIGSLTIDAVNNVEDQDKLLNRLAAIRKQYYTNLTYTDGKKNDQDVFLQGWLNRVDNCLKFKP